MYPRSRGFDSYRIVIRALKLAVKKLRVLLRIGAYTKLLFTHFLGGISAPGLGFEVVGLSGFGGGLGLSFFIFYFLFLV